MAYITNKERAWRVRSSNQSYLIRKILIGSSVGSLLILVIFAIATIANVAGAVAKFNGQTDIDGTKVIYEICQVPLSLVSARWVDNTLYTNISGFGWFMAIWTAITLGLSIAALVLMLLMKSPKSAKKNINVLQGAALSGKKLAAHANATQVYRERGTNPKKLKKNKAKK